MPLNSVTIWTKDGDRVELPNGADFLSFVNDDTYGRPPLITGEAGGGAVAESGDEVLYVNPSNILAVLVEKGSE